MSKYYSTIDNLELGDIAWDEDGDGTYRDVVLDTGEYVPTNKIDIQALNKSIATGAIHRAVVAGWLVAEDDYTSTPGINESSLARVFLATATSAVVTVTLPTSVGLSGRTFYVKKMDSSANAVVVSCTLAETIDGATKYSLVAQYDYIQILSDNANWQIVTSSSENAISPVNTKLAEVSVTVVSHTAALVTVNTKLSEVSVTVVSHTAALVTVNTKLSEVSVTVAGLLLDFTSGQKAITGATGSATVTIAGWGSTYIAVATFASGATLSADHIVLTQIPNAFSILIVNTVGAAVSCALSTVTINYLAIKSTL